MSEFDPSKATPQEQAVRDRSYDVLQWDPTNVVTELDKLPTRGADIPLADLLPLRIEGHNALIAAMRLGPDKEVNIWAPVTEDGNLAGTEVEVGSTNYGPNDDVSDGRVVSLAIPVENDAVPLLIGRNNPDAARRFDLPSSVSREHVAVSLLPNGVLRVQDLNSSFGTNLLVKGGRPAATEAVQETAVETDTIPSPIAVPDERVGRFGGAITEISADQVGPMAIRQAVQNGSLPEENVRFR
jgi:hypothetical protein